MSHHSALAAVTATGATYELRRRSEDDTYSFGRAPTSLREIFDQARSHGDAIFLTYGRERLSFYETFAGADSFAAALVDNYGVQPGDRVAIAMRNYPEWVMAFIGATSVGAVCVPLNSWWTTDELAYAVDDAAPAVIVADTERAALLESVLPSTNIALVLVRGTDTDVVHDCWSEVTPPAQRPDVSLRSSDDATILYTSGTTGHPKGAVSTHGAVVHALWGASAQEAVEATRLGQDFPAPSGDPGALLAVPLFHVTGCIAVMLNALRGGQKLVMMHRWDAEEALRLIEAERLTAFIGVPTQCFDIVNHPNFRDYDLSSLQWVGGGGAATPPSLLTQLGEQIPSASPTFGYGMTETNALGPAICCDEAHAFPDSVGWLAPSMELEIRDVGTGAAVPAGDSGEIWLRGPSLIRGYWNRPDATSAIFEHGWMRTGDVGHLDADGRVYIDDRLKDMVVRGGENVYCSEVEAALYEHPDVLEAAVFGVPDERLGEEVAASVLIRPGGTLERADLAAFLSARLATYKIPAAISFESAPLPRTPSGKFVKTHLRDRWLQSDPTTPSPTA